MIRKIAILDTANNKIILSKVSGTDSTEDIEAFLTEELGLSLENIHWQVFDSLTIEWLADER